MTIALVSLAVAGIPLVTTMGFMAAIAVVIAVLAALTLLPAVLGDARAAHQLAAGATSANRRTDQKGPVGEMGPRDLQAADRHRDWLRWSF